ncbi:NAD(P)H-binding protein [Streptomyces sp. MP131-18]|uniref:NAD(P)H-binding protein n=1 Tax=Streptomyces sp. MP131-18 TaxID=1857892 RepID=UPI00097CA120|nr:NAD(P)H-binding protein [Streptomyces sp. MP131-18]ONK12621.1 NAD(P)H azoreductase [Streptomyces sp. MP131-18]
MSERTIVVTGGTGKTGRRVARRLAERGLRVRAVSRSGSPRFDWTDRTTWAPTLHGATALYLVAPELGSPRVPGEIAALTREAAAAGVRRAVLLSAAGGGPYEEQITAAERALAGSGLAWTVLRPRWFHQNFDEDFLCDAVLTGEVRLPTGHGLEAFIDADDIAEVAVAALTGNGHAGRCYELSGPRLMTFADAVGEIARASGRDIRYMPVTAEAYADELKQQGAPAGTVALLVDLFAQVRAGHLTSLTDDVRRVLGRPPRDFADYARTAAERGAWRT